MQQRNTAVWYFVIITSENEEVSLLHLSIICVHVQYYQNIDRYGKRIIGTPSNFSCWGWDKIVSNGFLKWLEKVTYMLYCSHQKHPFAIEAMSQSCIGLLQLAGCNWRQSGHFSHPSLDLVSHISFGKWTFPSIADDAMAGGTLRG